MKFLNNLHVRVGFKIGQFFGAMRAGYFHTANIK